MLQNKKLMPVWAKRAELLEPASYKPRSNRLPLNNEKTLWKNGSLLGNSTVEPTGTARTWGSNVLFRWMIIGICRFGSRLSGTGSPNSSAEVSQITTFE